MMRRLVEAISWLGPGVVLSLFRGWFDRCGAPAAWSGALGEGARRGLHGGG